MFKFKNSILVLGFFLILVFLYRVWIFSDGILTFGDWYYFFPESLISSRMSYFNIWVSDFNLGRVVISMGQAPMWGAYGFIYNLFNLPYEFSLKIFHLFPIIFITPISIFILLNSLFKNNSSKFLGVIIYSFNTYFLTLQTGHLTLLVVFSLLPLIIYLFIESLDKKRVLYSFICGMLLSIGGYYEPRIVYIILFILFVYYIFTLFIIKKTLKNIFEYSYLALIPILIYLAFNLYWIIPLFNTGNVLSNEIFSRELFGNEFLKLRNALTLYHPFWSSNGPEIFSINNPPIYYWLVPLFAILGLLKNINNKKIIFFGILSIFGILLTKQSSAPFAGLYLWLFENFPGFNAFREASKFFSLIAISYAVLIPSFFDKAKFKNKYIFLILFSALSLIFIYNLKPLVIGSMGTMFVERTIPNDYQILRNKINSDNEYFRTLWIPNYSRWGTLSNEHPKIGLIELINSDWRSYLKNINIKEHATEGEVMNDFLKGPDIRNLMSNYSVRYVVIPLEDTENEDNFFEYYGVGRDSYINSVRNLEFLNEVDLGMKNVLLFENKEYRKHFWTNDIPQTEIHIINASPTKYEVMIKNIDKSFVLNFSDLYHPNWQVELGNNYIIKSDKSEYGSNSFKIDYSVLREKDLINNNELVISVEFESQKYVKLGFLAGVEIICLIIISAIVHKKIK